MHRECWKRFPRNRLQRKPLVSDPDMHRGTCVTHVPWCMSGSLTSGGGENIRGIPGACATPNFMYLARGPLEKGPWEKKWPPWLLTVSSRWPKWSQPAVTEPWLSCDLAVIILKMPWLSCDLAVTELWPSRDWAVTSPWPLLAVIIGPGAVTTVSSRWQFFSHGGGGGHPCPGSRPIWSQTCLMGFMTGLRAGQSMTSTSCCARKAGVSRALWSVALSWTYTMFLPKRHVTHWRKHIIAEKPDVALLV